jgi:hypothetical protein
MMFDKMLVLSINDKVLMIIFIFYVKPNSAPFLSFFLIHVMPMMTFDSDAVLGRIGVVLERKQEKCGINASLIE